MAEVLQQGVFREAPPEFRPGTQLDEAAVRRQLRDQVARLESELSALFCSAFPRTGFDWKVRSRGGPRVLSLSELEAVRDELAARLQHNRRVLSDRTYGEELSRRRLEEMLLHPEEHKWVRIRNEDIGERGCNEYVVKPRFWLVGMLMNWWRVKVSSGCPLAEGRGRRP